MIKVYVRVGNIEDLILAMRAVKWLLDQPETQKDAILAYGNEIDKYKTHFYVKRVKSGISVSPC